MINNGSVITNAQNGRRVVYFYVFGEVVNKSELT
jgi:hypothetical protein